MTKNITIGVLVVAVLAIGLYAFNTSALLSVSGTGQNHYQAENFLAGQYDGTQGQFRISNVGSMVEGGTVTTLTLTTSTPTSTISASSLCSNGLYVFNPNGASGLATGTVTLASASQLATSCLTTDGASLSFLVYNLGSNSTSTITFVGSTGTTLFAAGASSTATSSLQGSKLGVFTLIRRSSSTVYGMFSQGF